MISVIIPTLDRLQLLDAALGSVAAQDVAGGFEVIVVNDGGTSVAPVVRAWDRVMPVKVIELDRRSGPAAARNIGIGCADGEYIAFLDDDDLFMPGHLAAGREPLERNEADFVYLGAIVADRRLTGRPPDLTEFPLNQRQPQIPVLAYIQGLVEADRRVSEVANDHRTSVQEVRNHQDPVIIGVRLL